jgi:hypothetical protein
MTTYNSTPYNTSPYNGNLYSSESFLTDLAVFEGFSLADGVNTYIRRIINPGPMREIISGNIPRDDGQYVNNEFFRNRDITIEGWIKADTAAEFNQLIDTFKTSLREQEGILDITETGLNARRYTASLANYHEMLNARDYYHITFLPFVARFYCKPFGYDRDYTSDETDLTASGGQTVVYSGTIQGKAIISLNFSAASGITNINIRNEDTGEEIQYSPSSIAAGDIVVLMP